MYTQTNLDLVCSCLHDAGLALYDTFRPGNNFYRAYINITLSLAYIKTQDPSSVMPLPNKGFISFSEASTELLNLQLVVAHMILKTSGLKWLIIAAEEATLLQMRDNFIDEEEVCDLTRNVYGLQALQLAKVI